MRWTCAFNRMTISAKHSLVSFAFMIRHPAHVIALGGGAGLTPVAPGTAGTLVAYPIYFLAMRSFSFSIQLMLIAGLLLLGIWCCAVTGRNLGVVDHGAIVWDEVVAMLLVLVFTPFGWVWYVIAFALFRAMDILKPFPIRLADRKIKNGFGVMFDDILAAIYTILILQILESMLHG